MIRLILGLTFSAVASRARLLAVEGSSILTTEDGALLALE